MLKVKFFDIIFTKGEYMDKLNINDSKKYLQQGALTQIFCNNDEIIQNINRLLLKNNLENTDLNKLICLNEWVLEKLHFTKNPELARERKFDRTAQEIWDSGKMTGCTDCAMIFATLAREIGIPATLLATAAQNWVDKFKIGDDYRIHYGHAFCECLCDGKWVLFDPTFKEITPDYDANKICLAYNICDCNVFIPYFRGLDIEKRQTIQDYNKQMETEIEKFL